MLITASKDVLNMSEFILFISQISSHIVRANFVLLYLMIQELTPLEKYLFSSKTP